MVTRQNCLKILKKRREKKTELIKRDMNDLTSSSLKAGFSFRWMLTK